MKLRDVWWGLKVGALIGLVYGLALIPTVLLGVGKP